MKKKIVAIVLVGMMTLSSFVPAVASRNSKSVSGRTDGFSATGTITIDNVTNEAIATVTTSVPCGIHVTAIFVYNGGNRYPVSSSNYATSCTAVAQKSGVQAESGIGVFTATKGEYAWSTSCEVPVI